MQVVIYLKDGKSTSIMGIFGSLSEKSAKVNELQFLIPGNSALIFPRDAGG